MCDHEQTTGTLFQMFFQPGDGFGVDVIGRFVEDEQVGGVNERMGQRHALMLSAAEGVNFSGEVGDAKAGEDGFRFCFSRPPVGLIHLSANLREFGLHFWILWLALKVGANLLVGQQQLHLRGITLKDRFDDRQVWVDGGVLGQELDAHVAPNGEAACCQRFLPGNDAQQGCFAAAVGADEADMVALVDEQANVIEEGAFSHVEGGVL